MTARQEAIDAMEAAHDTFMSWGQILDAIPRGVLARLAIEQGGLEQEGWLTPDNPSDDSPDVALYRVVEQS